MRGIRIGVALGLLVWGGISLAQDFPLPSSGPDLLPSGGCGEGTPAPCPQGQGERGPLAPGAPAEPVLLSDPGGNPVIFSPGDPGSRPTLLVFWSMFCPPCQDEMPYLAGLGKKTGIQVITVNLDGTRMARAVANYARLNRIEVPVAMDEKAQGEFATAAAYGVTGTPGLFLIDAAGVVRWSHQGRVAPEVLEEEIRRLTAGGP